MIKHLSTPLVSLERHTKDNNKNQLQQVYDALFVKPMTMYQVEKQTGVNRSNVCRYVKELREQHNIALVRIGMCPISKHSKVQFFTTNPELYPKKRQLELFDKTQ